MTEKRKERRVHVDLPAVISYKGDQFAAKIDNMSRLGAYIEVDKDIAPGEDIDIAFKIPGHTYDLSSAVDIKCKGEIFRHVKIERAGSERCFGLGVFFIDFSSPKDKDKLSGYVDFLVEQGKETAQAGLKRWKEKKKTAANNSKYSRKDQKKQNHHSETISLLKQVLSRLEDIFRQLKGQDK